MAFTALDDDWEVTTVNAGQHGSYLVSISPGDMIIAVIGPNSSGKSSLVTTMTGKDVTSGHDLVKYRLNGIHPVSCKHPAHPDKRVVFLDTPGFGDTYLSDMEVLERIGTWLRETFSDEVKLSGILVLTRITEGHALNISSRSQEMFQKLCGIGSLAKVFLVTTMWDAVQDGIGAEREEHFKGQWIGMINKGIRVARFDGTSSNGWSIVGSLEAGPQGEFVNQRKDKFIIDTSSGHDVDQYDVASPTALTSGKKKEGDRGDQTWLTKFSGGTEALLRSGRIRDCY